jgi:hypothetical protein
LRIRFYCLNREIATVIESLACPSAISGAAQNDVVLSLNGPTGHLTAAFKLST